MLNSFKNCWSQETTPVRSSISTIFPLIKTEPYGVSAPTNDKVFYYKIRKHLKYEHRIENMWPWGLLKCHLTSFIKYRTLLILSVAFLVRLNTSPKYLNCTNISIIISGCFPTHCSVYFKVWSKCWRIDMGNFYAIL